MMGQSPIIELKSSIGRLLSFCYSLRKIAEDTATKRILSTIRDYFSETNKLLWIICLCVSIYSLILIYSMQRVGEYNFLKNQLLAVSLGYAGAVFLSVVDYRFWVKHWKWIAAIGLIMLIFVFIFGIQVEGTDDTAWLRLPGGITFQPSELVKVLFVITFSKHLTYLLEKDYLKTFSGVLSLVIHALIPIVIIHLQGDDGAVLIFIFQFLLLCFAAGVQLRYFAILFGGMIICAPLIWTFFLNDEHRNRILALFDLDGNAMTDYGWQQYQGKVSIASGGFSGYGLGKGPRVEYEIVPEQENDFILTVAGEELGFIGCVLILLLLFILCLCVVLTAKKTNDACGKLICFGVFAIIASQSAVNIGMVLGFIPVIGITLPFFSAGGTSAMCLYFAIGLVQSVYMHIETPDIVRIPIGSENRVKI